MYFTKIDIFNEYTIAQNMDAPTKNKVNAMKDKLKKQEDNVDKVNDELDSHKTDKSWISSKIAWLRGLYAKTMAKYKAENDAGKAGFFKKVGLKIMQVVDKFLKALSDISTGAKKINGDL